MAAPRYVFDGVLKEQKVYKQKDNRVKVLSYVIFYRKTMRMFTHDTKKKYGTTLTSRLKTHRPISVLPTTSRAAGCLCFSRRRSIKDTGLYHVTRLDLNVKKLASYSAARSFTRRTKCGKTTVGEIETKRCRFWVIKIIHNKWQKLVKGVIVR